VGGTKQKLAETYVKGFPGKIELTKLATGRVRPTGGEDLAEIDRTFPRQNRSSRRLKGCNV
jgi:hypothetical protein